MHPLVPPGTKVIIHEKTTQRGINGWYLGPSMEHYRCHRVYCNATSAERVTDTIKIFPHYGNLPTLTAQEAAVLAQENIQALLEDKTNQAQFGAKQLEALQQLAESLGKTAATPHTPMHLIPQLQQPTPTNHSRNRGCRYHSPHIPTISDPEIDLV